MLNTGQVGDGIDNLPGLLVVIQNFNRAVAINATFCRGNKGHYRDFLRIVISARDPD